MGSLGRLVGASLGKEVDNNHLKNPHETYWLRTKAMKI
jgi:hypothetical protein